MEKRKPGEPDPLSFSRSSLTGAPLPLKLIHECTAEAALPLFLANHRIHPHNLSLIMPIHLSPLSRRQFITRSVAAGMQLELHSLDPSHQDHGQVLNLEWRT